MKDRLLEKLSPFGQQHLLALWDQLTADQQRQLAAEIDQVDWKLVSELYRGDDETPDWGALAQRAEAPRAVCPATDPASDLAAARDLGTAALREGRIGMVLVAGGQGTRLGFHHPKGMFPLGPVSQRTLFQIVIDRLRAVARRHGVAIPLYLMTSPATHEETVEFFTAHDRFGLPASDLKIFCQGVMPALAADTGRALLQSPHQLCLSPDGHGGMLAALARSGCLSDARQRGIDQLFYGQIDNPLLQVCDPLLLGCQLAADAEMTTQVVRKVDPLERVGNVVQVDGRVRIIEYSDLPADVAARRGAGGGLLLWAGNLAVHVFDCNFLERMVDEAEQMPFHRANKAVEFLGSEGRLVQPEKPNAIKFERFIFDLLPAAQRAVVVECDKRDAFAPVKNAPGAAADTAELAQQAMIDHDLRLLREGGAVVADGVAVEVNPCWALDKSEVAAKVEPGTVIESPTYFV